MNVSPSPVLITGMGVVSAAGAGINETLTAFRKGIRRAGPVTRFETTLQLPVFEAPCIPGEEKYTGMRTQMLALTAAREALDRAGISKTVGLRIGVALGTTVASQLNDLAFYTAFRRDKCAPMDAVNRYLKGNLAAYVAEKIGAVGPQSTVVNACSSGADAVGLAITWLRGGLCDIAVAGGADELNRIPLCGFNALGVASDKPCRPFDRDRTGLNLGEGAGVLVLETAASAAMHGRRSALALAGSGYASDAHHLTAPHPEGRGLRKAIDAALRMATITPEQICFVNAHGTSTRENDKTEGRVLKDLFPRAHILSTKGYTGHTLGAAGGLEAAFTAAALQAHWLPASVGWQHFDEETRVSLVTENTEIQGEYALSTSLAFGGSNAALIVQRLR